VSGIELSGADAGNYSVDASMITTGDITGVARPNIPGAIADAASLPPAMPPQLTPSVPTPPSAVLDLTLPIDFGGAGRGGGANSGTTGTAVASDAASDGHINVSLVQPATAKVPGIVSVSVPEQMVSSGKGFSFPLPEELAAAAAAGRVRVTLMNGERLPSWLRYVRGAKTFVASAMPAGALPMDVWVRIGAQSWTVRITVRTIR
jgi:hypothetical protein